MTGGAAQRERAAEDEAEGTSARAPGPTGPAGGGRVPAWWVVAAVALVATPLVVALVVQHGPRWYPSGDSAQIELRVRDVFSSHPPKLGLGGRIGGTGVEQGSHPGPLAFYLMAPVHRVLGDTAWALQVATAAVHVLALGTALWFARRRGGPLLFLGTVAVLGLLVAALTGDVLTEPWNPYLPLLWLPAFLLAVWSTTCDDLVALPVAAFAGSVCVQTHVPYAGVVLAGAAVVAGWAGLRLWRPPPGGPARARVAGAVAAGAAVALVVWLPPLYQQVRSDDGNLAKIIDYFSDPPGDVLGPGDGIRVLVVRLDPWRLLTDRTPEETFVGGGSTVPGTALLLLEVGAVAVAWRLRHRSLLRLHLVVGAALVAAALAFTRIYGPPFGYLSLWSLGVACLIVLAVGWTVAALVGRGAAGRGDRWRRAAAPVLGSAAVALVVLGVVEAVDAEPPEPLVSALLGGVVPDTVRILRSGDLPGTGEDGRYRVTAVDPVYLGFPVHGLIDELERAGLTAGADRAAKVAITEHRVLREDEVTAEVHLAVGPAVASEARVPGAVEVARIDPRSPAERARWDRARADAVRGLEAAGATDLVERVEETAVISGDPRVDPATRAHLDELREIGMPMAVFVIPAD